MPNANADSETGLSAPNPIFADRGRSSSTFSSDELRILTLLRRAHGGVVRHAELVRALWGGRANEHSQYLVETVDRLRKKLALNATRSAFVVTELGVGYRLVE